MPQADFESQAEELMRGRMAKASGDEWISSIFEMATTAGQCLIPSSRGHSLYVWRMVLAPCHDAPVSRSVVRRINEKFLLNPACAAT